MLLQIIYFFITKKLLKLEQEFGFEDGGEYVGHSCLPYCANGPNMDPSMDPVRNISH